MNEHSEFIQRLNKLGMGTANENQVMRVLRDTGDHLAEALNLPPGLSAWLHAQGLSLIPTRDPEVAQKKRAWDDEPEEKPVGVNYHEEFKVGDRVQYITGVAGKVGISYVGSGVISHHTHTAMEKSCQFRISQGAGAPDRLIFPAMGDRMEKI